MSKNERELDEDGNIPGLPSIQTIPEEEMDDEPKAKEGDELIESYKQRWDDLEYGDKIKERYEELTEELEKSEGFTYEDVDDALLRAIQKSSWWVDDRYEDGADLSKAPGIWRGDDQVPEYVREVIEEVIESNRWDWAQFESLTPAEATRLKEVVKEKLTQPQGWSVGSLSEDLQRELSLEEDAATGIAADASHNVLNVAREEGYEQMEGSEEFVYDWIGPADHRTTEVCEEIKEEIEDRGGAVSLPTLKQIVREKALKYEGTEEGGTPQRADVYEPHYQCRHTFVRRVQ